LSKEEAVKLLKDKIHRLTHLYYIQNEVGEVVLFKLRDAQKRFLEEMHYRNIILKSRQLGFTTLIELWTIDECLFRSNTQAAVIAQTREDVKEIFDKKIKFPWDKLHPSLKCLFKETSNSANKLAWNNGSSIRVAQSVRSSTLQILHISEFGKISAKYPDKAKEIVTGSLNALHGDSHIFIESTAEGDEGKFFDMCESARKYHDAGKPLTSMDYKFHFYPWWQEKGYRLEGDVLITQNLHDYFDTLSKVEGIELDEQQKKWYAKKWESNGEDMFSEFPSTPDEAFKSTKEGRYFSKEIAIIRQKRQITEVPYNEKLKVYTGWDLGVADPTCIWFCQVDGPFYRLIDYIEMSDGHLDYFANALEDKREQLGYRYKKHFLPHDGANRSMGHKKGYTRERILKEEYGLDVVVTERIKREGDGIDLIRRNIPNLWIDEERCYQGIKALDNYKREFDYRRGVYSDRPFHNWASHGTKALQSLLLGLHFNSKKDIKQASETVMAMNQRIAGNYF